MHRLGPYELREELGRGAMGVVFRAYHERLQRDCAIKLIQHRLGGNEDRFAKEGQSVARLGKHRNIVQVFDAGVHDGTPYIAMEFVNGRPLDDILKERGRFPEREALELARKLALAVEHAHRRGVVHRDLKPGNVILDDSGEPHILDFGLAADIGELGEVSDSILGTPQYMPPEQADPVMATADQRSDVYSLGATLYECLTGRPPFVGTDAVGTLIKVLTKEPPPARRVADISADAEAVVMKALEKSRRRRYQRARDLADDIERVLEGHVPEARPVGPATRAWRWVRRNAAVVGLVAVLAVFAGIAAWMILARQAEAEALWQRVWERTARAASDQVRERLEPAVPLMEEMRGLGRMGMLPIGDEVALAERLAQHYRYRQGIDWLSFGDEQGLYSGARRTKDGDIIVNQSRFVGGKNHLAEDYFGPDGSRKPFKRDEDWQFDHRKRGWYALAQKHDGPVWTEPYLWYDQTWGITLTAALRKAGELVGVFTVDFRLADLSRFLASLEALGKDGRAFLLTRAGQVFARSDADETADGDAPHPLLDAAIAELPKPLTEMPAGETATVEFDHGDRTWSAALEVFQVRGGLELAVATIVPKDQLRGDLASTARVLTLVGAALVLLTLGVAITLAWRRRRRLAKRHEG